ncbi:hypothetical protein HZB07_03850 [Candidatus Saganbacteria bacterium]|nr:hypothetical protein [Candidatus Saganbacteria bacterium]
MKKGLISLLLLALCASLTLALPSGSAPYGVGAKYAAMGGAGSAIADDLSCVYYNPAGIMKTGNFELKLGAGAAAEGLSDMINLLSKASSPAKFLSDNYSKSLAINGSLSSLVSLNIGKIGLSILPIGSLSVSKAANTIAGTVTAGLNTEALLTMGYNWSLPMLPIASLDVGLNVKSANSIAAISAGTASGTTFATSDIITNYSGIGFDVGARGELNTFVVPLSVAVVLKDIGETLKGKVKTVSTNYDSSGAQTSQISTETDAADYTSPQTLVLGFSTTIPGIGVKVALDLDSVSGTGGSYSLTHLGVEYPMMGLIALRAGMVSGGPGGGISQTTVGAGLLGILNVAMITDNNNNKNNSTVVDFGLAF